MSTLISILASQLKALGFTLLAFTLIILSIWWIITSIYRQTVENGWQAFFCCLAICGTVNWFYLLSPMFDAFDVTARAMKILISYLPYLVLALIPAYYHWQRKRNLT